MKTIVCPLAYFLLLGCGRAPSVPTSTRKLDITVDAFNSRGHILPDFASRTAGKIPTVTWAGVPAQTVEMVLIVEDPDAPGSDPFCHWAVVGLTPRPNRFPDPKQVSAHQGINSSGSIGYLPPSPPPGQVHHYHFMVFALNTHIRPSPVTREAVVSAMQGHVIAEGDAVGLYP